MLEISRQQHSRPGSATFSATIKNLNVNPKQVQVIDFDFSPKTQNGEQPGSSMTVD